MAEQNPNKIGLYSDIDERNGELSSISERFGIPVITTIPDDRYYLYLGQDGLSLRRHSRGNTGPIRIDFTSVTSRYRRLSGGGRRQTLARAIGLTPGYNPAVFDATAGMGKDAFVLASCG